MIAKNPICVGSGLIALDVIFSDKEIQPKFLAGGSCGNVLTILSYMGWDSYPIARLGEDVEGKRIIEDMKKWRVKTKFIERESGIDSPRIIERIFGGENPKHRFYLKCEHGNWLPRTKSFLLKSFENIQNKIPKSNVFYFDRATPSAYEIALHLKKQGAIIVFEPPKFLQDDKTFLKCIKIADIVKHCYDQAKETERSITSIPLEIQTKGKEGLQYKARFLGHKSWKKLPAIATYDLTDAAGSGDWLTAGLIHMLHNHKQIEQVSEKKLEYALDFGQTLASLNCNYGGARGMMYNMSKPKLFLLAKKILKHKEKRTFSIDLPVKTPKVTPIAKKCKICLCAN